MGSMVEKETTSAGKENRLEQVYLNMPEAKFYFSGDRSRDAEDVSAYIGSEELTRSDLQRFSESGENIYYYVLLDISASISERTFSELVQGLAQFAENLNAEDRMTLVTFGEEVQTVFDCSGEELAGGAAAELFSGLINRDQRTLLFEAVSQAAQMAGQVPADACTRRVALVITDGEDIARGMATKDEALRTLSSVGLPVYGFTVSEAKRDAMNAFGEFSRSTGGYLTIVENGEASAGFERLRGELEDSYVAVFDAGSNRVSRGMVQATLELAGSGTQQTEAMQERWIADTESPVVEAVTAESDSQLKVLFSEAVDGAQAAENYTLTDEAGTAYTPAFASVGSDGTSVILTFSGELGGGSYVLSLDGITDQSMEQNAVVQTAAVEIPVAEVSGEKSEEQSEGQSEEQETGPSPMVYAGIGLAALVFVILAVVLLRRRQKKEKAPQEDGGRRVAVTPHPDGSLRVAMERPRLEEKQVFFRVKGQQEEIPVKIRSSLIVGRSSSCQLIFDDPALSRQHFALELAAGEVLVRNLSGSGFTTVNGRRLGAEARPLHSGDEIGAGQLVMTVRW